MNGPLVSQFVLSSTKSSQLLVTIGIPEAMILGWYCLMSLITTWMMEKSTLSANLWMIPNCGEVVEMLESCSSKWPWQGGGIGWQEPHTLHISKCKVLQLGWNNPLQPSSILGPTGQGQQKSPSGFCWQQIEHEFSLLANDTTLTLD